MAQISGSFSSIAQVQNEYLAGQSKKAAETEAFSFQEVLKQKAATQAGTLKFSKHANERLVSRNITLTGEQVERLQEGVSRAREKGIRESLVLLDNLSFIVNVKNDTVVTALDNHSEQHVFTNIDGAVIA